MPEQRQAFQRELDAIDAMVIEMFALVAADLARAAVTFPDGNGEVVEVLTEHGLVIDLLGPEIERRAKTAILLQAPVASDLRFLLCVLNPARARALLPPGRAACLQGQPHSRR